MISKIKEALKYIDVVPLNVTEMGDAFSITLPMVQWNSMESGDFFRALKAIKLYINDINESNSDVMNLIVSTEIRPRWSTCSYDELQLHLEDYKRIKNYPATLSNEYRTKVNTLMINSIQKDIDSR